MLKRFLLLVFICSVILAAMVTFSPKVAQASGGPLELAGVAVVSDKNVWAAGEIVTSTTNTAEAIVEHWDGHTWQISPSATPAGALGSALLGITAISRDDVWAVGDISVQAGSFQPLTEHWNGAQWQIVPSPVLPDSFLNGVAAVSAHDIWAVGVSAGSTLIERWDGSSWSTVPSSNPGSNGNELKGVVAISAHDVWAVGDYRDSNFAELPLIEHWNGSSWSTVPSPNPGSFTSLNGVAATSAHDVWAVGSFFDSTNTTQAFVEHWNGSSWQATIGLNPAGSTGSFLQGVTAVSHKDVWAVGFTNPPVGSGNLLTLIEHWNGSSWQIVPSPNIAGVNGPLNFLNGVAAVPHGKDAWAVGRATDQSGSSVTLVEAWNGAKWRIIPSPTPS
ncbi:MAG: hypothetical protein NVS4B11_10600 [Ktedonobacteraceae bacterium]